MQLLFQGVDIAPQVGISVASIIDGAGGQLDSVEAVFTDTDGLWSRWNPKINDSIRMIQDGFDSGECFVDQRGQRKGGYILRGLSAPSGIKIPRSRSWEQVTFLQLAADIGSNHGLTVSPYNVQDQTYAWADQDGQGDLEFLFDRCVLEGCSVKVNGGKLILYGEAAMEFASPVRIIRMSDFCGDPEYTEDQQGTCSGCIVTYGNIMGEFVVPGGSGAQLVRADIYVTSIGEAQRFAKGLARQANRRASMLTGSILLDCSLAGGSMVQVSGVGTADGIYMVDEAEHILTAGITSLRLRRRLEGY